MLSRHASISISNSYARLVCDFHKKYPPISHWFPPINLKTNFALWVAFRRPDEESALDWWINLVDLAGFEPATSSVRLMRAPNCATGPFGFWSLSWPVWCTILTQRVKSDKWYFTDWLKAFLRASVDRLKTGAEVTFSAPVRIRIHWGRKWRSIEQQ